MWFKAKCPQCARLQKEFPSFMSDFLFIVPKLIKEGYDPYWRETIPETKDTAMWFKLTSARYSPFHFTALFIGSKPLPTVWAIPFTRLWVLVWFPPTHTLVESLSEYFLSVGCHHRRKSGSIFYVDCLWLSPLTLHSLRTFFWDRQEVGHLAVWICSPWLCSHTKIYNFTFFTFQICLVGDYIPSNAHSFHGPHPRLSWQHFFLMPTQSQTSGEVSSPISFLSCPDKRLVLQ